MKTRIMGTVESITPDYPFTVTMKNGKTFVSHFKFTPGAKIILTFEGNTFTWPWPSGFWHCFPNGFSETTLTPETVAMAKHPKYWAIQPLPQMIREAVKSPGKVIRWKSVESFYCYHYSAEFNPETRVVKTNYCFRY